VRRIALVVLIALAGCGGDDSADAPEAKVTPVPTIFGADLKPGTTYTTTAFEPRLRLTFPEGEWKVLSADKPGNLEFEPDTVHPVTEAALGFYHHPKVFDAAKGGTMPGDATEAPSDFAAWLTSHPHLATTKPKPVEVMGLEGVSIDVRVKSAQPRQYKDCGKVLGKCVVMTLGGVEPVVYGSDSRGRWLVLDLGGGDQLVVEQFVTPPAAFANGIKLLDAALAQTELAD
jgi:hypothetical protein